MQNLSTNLPTNVTTMSTKRKTCRHIERLFVYNAYKKIAFVVTFVDSKNRVKQTFMSILSTMSTVFR